MTDLKVKLGKNNFWISGKKKDVLKILKELKEGKNKGR